MKISIIGAGGWGTTLSILLSKKGHTIKLWSFENKKFLPGFEIPPEVLVTCKDEEAVADAELIIFAVPSKYFRNIVKRFSLLIKKNLTIVSAAKGLEEDSHKRMSEILTEELKLKKIAVLSGPNLSKEIAEGLPAASIVASSNLDIAKEVQKIVMTENFRIYTSTDVIGVELGGALKNIIAIAAGIVDGLKLGDNAKAGLMVRGLVEITRLGVRLGAKKETFAGLSGIGDLITTCSSNLSRNHRVGVEIANGKSLSEIQKNMIEVAEGVPTTKAVYELSKKYKVEMPITEQVYNVLFNNKNPKQAILELMRREAKEEKL